MHGFQTWEVLWAFVRTKEPWGIPKSTQSITKFVSFEKENTAYYFSIVSQSMVKSWGVSWSKKTANSKQEEMVQEFFWLPSPLIIFNRKSLKLSMFEQLIIFPWTILNLGLCLSQYTFK